MNRLGAYAVVLGLAISFQAPAADDRYPIAGAGASSCGKWLEARAMRSMEVDSTFGSWVQGFLSGMNMQRSLMTKDSWVLLPDMQSILAYVDKHCRDNPLHFVDEASLALYVELQAK